MTKWEINRVSTPERICDKIETEMPQPVVILIVGADCDFKKKEVVDKITSHLPNAAVITNAAPTPTLVQHIQNHNMVTIILNSEESASRELRRELVKVIRNAGAKTVVGVYAKAAYRPLRPTVSTPERAKFNRQIQAIEKSNPTASEFDYFIIAPEKKGE